MLKVVGASWLKTRISSYILAGAGLLAIGSLFLAEMERTQYDGTYCATVYWSHQTGFRVEFWGQQNNLQQIPKGVARTCYKDSTLDNGWAQIEIETQPNYPDWIQAYSAGILEGALTWKKVYNHWSNTIESYCEKDEKSQQFCIWLRDVISNNYENIKDIADQRGKHDHYWYQIRLFYYQLEGLEYGWRKGVRRSRADLEIELEDFLLLNAASGISDLRTYYENLLNFSDDYEYHAHPPKASMMVKFLEKNGVFNKVLMGHSSDGSYSSMLRVLKKYKFHYHHSNDNKTPEVPGVDIAFTGYPGSIASSDDFYIIAGKKTKLTIGGIRIQNNNLDLWKNVNIENSVFLSARVMTANRLAHSGRTWSKIMSRNPGIGTKQWIVVDVKRLDRLADIENTGLPDFLDVTDKTNATTNMIVTNEQRLNDSNYYLEKGKQNIVQKGVVWIIDQLPGRLHAEDMTQEIVYGSGFWSGNGVPYFKAILNASHITYDETERKTIQKIAANITDLESITKVLKSRGYRGDLMGENASAFGNIDIKLYSESNLAEMEFHALAGPIYYNTNNHNLIDKESIDESLVNDQLSEIEIFSERRSVRDDIRAIAMLKANGPFKWSNTQLDVEHSGHPDVWNFDRVSPVWAWKHDSV